MFKNHGELQASCGFAASSAAPDAPPSAPGALRSARSAEPTLEPVASQRQRHDRWAASAVW